MLFAMNDQKRNFFNYLRFIYNGKSMKLNSDKGRINIILHILAWILFLGLPLYSARRMQMGNDFLVIYYTILAINGLIFYINYLFLVPRYFFQKKKYRYYLSAFILIVFFYFVSDISSNLLFRNLADEVKPGQYDRPPAGMRNPEPPVGIAPVGGAFRGSHVLGYSSTAIFIVFFSLGLKVLERQSKIEKMQEEMEKEKLNSELAFLKNQISPHFFFNTLNNIYSLIAINAEDSQNAVLKLSKLMRYLLYESEHGDTKLSQEIDFMKNYIDLMKLRMSERVTLNVFFPEEYADRNMQPLLFIPFIENSFKHGISYREQSFIDINMTAEADSITFKCSNSLHTGGDKGAETKAGGIGLENVRKRLNLLFPGSHDLRINRSDNRFDVVLEIKTA